jgi:hypothetical protein
VIVESMSRNAARNVLCFARLVTVELPHKPNPGETTVRHADQFMERKSFSAKHQTSEHSVEFAGSTK